MSIQYLNIENFFLNLLLNNCLARKAQIWVEAYPGSVGLILFNHGSWKLGWTTIGDQVLHRNKY